MVTETRRLFAVLLLCLLLISICPSMAFAADSWAETKVEQSCAVVPHLELFFYPLSSSGSIVFGINDSNTDIMASLNGEALSVKYLSDVRTQGTSYIVAVNVSSQLTGFGYIQSVKNSLKYWIDTMGEKDKLILISYTDEAQVLLDGSETRVASVAGLNALTTDTAKPDPAAAVRLAIKLRQEMREDYPQRAVLLMFDDGSFLSVKNNAQDVLMDSLRQAELPLYGICHEEKMTAAFSAAAESTGGIAVNSNGYNCEEECKEMHSYLDGCYVLGLEASDNKLSPNTRELNVSFTYEGQEHIVKRSVNIAENIPDDVAPTVLKAYLEDDTNIIAVFSEPVSGADNIENYRLSSEDGTEIEVTSVEYSKDGPSVKLQIAQPLPAGENRLELKGIKDISQEENALIYDSDYLWVVVNGESVEESEELPVVPVIVLSAILVVAIIVTVLVFNNKKKQRLAEQERILREQAERERAEKERLAAELQIKNAASAREACKNPAGHSPDPGIVEDRAKDFPVMLYILLPNGIKRTNQISIRENYFIGRKSGNNLQINDDKMSGSHFKLSVSYGRLIVSDLGSTNGTFVNGVKIDKSRVLQSGDVILAGGTKFSIRFELK